MPEKTSVTVPLTTRQKEQIKKMTGQTINALKVESAGGATLAKRAPHMLAGRSLARKYLAKTLSKKAAPRTLARAVVGKTLARAVVGKTLARVVVGKTIA